jgi:hypothetical protein
MSFNSQPEPSKELWQIRLGCKSTLKPWVQNTSVLDYPVSDRTGNYFIIGFTNNHAFTSDGTITLKLKE